MEGDSSPLNIIGARPLGNPVHCDRTTGGANQRLLVPVRRDQNQRFRRTVLLDAPTSHSRPFRWGGWWHGSGYPTRVNLGNLMVRRKGIPALAFDLESQWLAP